MMETFTRKKPTEDMFAGEMSLKRWVEDFLPLSEIEVIDANLRGAEGHSAMDCISSLMRLALECCAESPGQRIDMKNVSVTLNKIKLKFLQDVKEGA